MKRIKNIFLFATLIATQPALAMDQQPSPTDHTPYEDDFRLYDNRYTPLTCAAEDGNEATCEQLINAGADVNEKNGRGLTPLSYAAANGHESVVRLFLKLGANIDTNDRGQTPLFRACFAKQLKICSLLLKHGANVNAVCKDGHTPLIRAAEPASPHPLLCQLLLFHGAEITIQTNDGWTALMGAALMGNEEKNEETCKIFVNHQKELESRIFTLLVCLKRITPSDECAKFLYRERKTVLWPHLKRYTLKMLLNAKKSDGSTAYSLSSTMRELHGKEPLEFLKPIETERE